MKATRFFTLRPAIATAAFVAGFLVSLQNSNSTTIISEADTLAWFWWAFEAFLNVGISFLSAAWIYETGLASVAHLDGNNNKVLRIALWGSCAFALLGVVVALLVLEARVEGEIVPRPRPLTVAIALMFGGAYFVSAWSSAALLARAETSYGKASSTFINFVMFLYLFVGVWFLSARLSKLQKFRAPG